MSSKNIDLRAAWLNELLCLQFCLVRKRMHFLFSDVTNKCPPPPLPPNAHIIADRRMYRSGDRVRIQCQSGYEIRGSGEIRCEKGKWTSPPICMG